MSLVKAMGQRSESHLRGAVNTMAEVSILVVEDEGIVAMDISRALKRLGYNVPAVASSGAEAIQKASEIQPDMVLMDIMLRGEMDGVEAAGQIRARLDIPVVYLTANDDEDTLRRVKLTGPYGYLLKPFRGREELRTAVEIALYKHGMEKELKERERWLAATLKSIGDGVIATDADGGIRFMNPVAEATTGWTQEEALGKDLAMAFNAMDEGNNPSTKRAIEESLREADAVSQMDHVLVTKQGMEIPVCYSVAPIMDDKGDTGVVLAFRDISERKKAEKALRKAYTELEEMQQKLIQSEKLAALGRFSAGITHEVKNPLAIVLSGIEVLEMRSPDADEVTITVMGKIKKATLRANDVLMKLLKFARPSELELERLRPRDLVNDALSFFTYKAPLQNIEIETQFSEEDIYIEVDSLQIQQVLLNLLMNSVEAMPKGGEIKVKTYKSGSSEGRPCCVIEVVDSGEGIKKDNLPNLFEPFFTTKRDSKGTGLGLSVSRMVVDNHDGELLINSELGKGTDAKIILPLADVSITGIENPVNQSAVESAGAKAAIY